jgi:lysozyme
MKLSQKGIDLIKQFEGLRLEAYLCPAKVPTIGYGATFYEDGTKVKICDKITKERAEELLKWHLETFGERVKPMLKKPLTDNQYSAVLSFTYNLGIGNLKTSKLLRKINIDPSDETIREEFLKWKFANGKVLEGLVRRRIAESRLYVEK